MPRRPRGGNGGLAQEVVRAFPSEVRELEVVSGRGGRTAAVIQKTDKQGLSAVGVECEFSKKDGGCRRGSLS